MSFRYLFGPVTAAFAAEHLAGSRQAGACLAFDAAGTTDLAIATDDTWETITSRLPAGWQPDFVALNLAYTTIPAGLWQAPVPLVGLAADTNLLWHGYRRLLPRCDVILTDACSVDRLHRAGLAQARPANLYGLGRPFLEQVPRAAERDIDILFVGNLHAAVQRERLPWLGRLARLAGRWRVQIRTGVFGDAYRDLLGRARLIFNNDPISH